MSELEPSNAAPRGLVSFIGAGPGAADLITIRAANRLAEADIVVWAASLVTLDCVRDHARPDAELVDSSRITHEDVLDIYRRALRDRLKVARVHSGDPALWGAVQEQYDACLRMDLDVEIVPGVSAFSAAAAAIGRELTVPEVAQSVVLTRLEGGKTPMPEKERIRDFAKHGTTMAIFLSAARAGQLAEELRAGGYAEDTPIVVAYKVTWPDELILRTTLGEVESAVKENKLWRHTLFLVGQALRSGGTRSRLYHAGHFHTYRKADKEARRALRAARTDRGAGAAPVDTAAAVPSPADPGDTRGSQDGRPNAETAWWAVRNWQETARMANRPAPARARSARRPGQDGLFDRTTDDAEPHADHAPATAERAAEPAVSEPAVSETENGGTASGSAAAAASAPPRVTARVTSREHGVEPSTAGPDAVGAAEPVAAHEVPARTDTAASGEESKQTSTAKSTRAGAKSKAGARKAGQTRARRKSTGSS